MFGFPPGGRRLRTLILSALGLSGPSLAAEPEQARLGIRHEAVSCLLRDGFPLFRAEIFPTDEIGSAKLYFRAERFVEFYYVVMSPTERGSYQAVIPRPAPETDRIVYYIEVVGLSFDSARSAEHIADIEKDCRDPAAAYFPGQNPGITVGATEAGAAAIPPGFQAGGITGFISAAGAAASAGGGFGVGTAILIGAGAAAGVGVIGASNGNGSTTSQPSGVMVTTTSATTTAGSTSTTVPPTSAPTSSTTSSAPPGQPTSSSTTSSVPPGSSTTTIIPTSTTTTAPTTSTTTTIVGGPTACFTMRSLSVCRVELDARCSSGAITEYRWTFHESGGPVDEARSTPDLFVHDWSGDSACHDSCSFSRRVELVVLGPGGSDRFADNARVTCLVGLRSEVTGLATSFLSFLEVQPGDRGGRAEVRVNADRVDVVDVSATVHHHLRARAGENMVEAQLLTPVGGGGFWRFDFSGTEHFVAGSLLVEAGNVVSLDAHSVVFRLGGSPGERIQFRYRLSPR